MIFNSVTYLVFLSIVIPLYWLLPTKIRLWFIFLASLLFYGFWRAEFLILMLFSAGIDFFAAIAIDATPKENIAKRRVLLALTMTLNLGLLFYFKYLYFVSENINYIWNSLGHVGGIPLYRVLLPFGISFYTFETISYTIDVYRGILKPERKFINYALFVTFFPKLVAGPIQRASELIEQLKTRTPFRLEFVDVGLRRILYGLFIKVFLADNLGSVVDEGFASDPSLLSALDVLTISFLFGFQIYFDFSAYSHIALGTAKMMGIDIPENFDFPYIASSFKEFWKRWHVSLSAWIRDYLYLPLSGVKVVRTSGREGIGSSLNSSKASKRNLALFLTWAIMGLWHGANWTFLLWGLYHASLIFAERFIGRLRIPGPDQLRWVVAHFSTLLLVMVGWIPFRSKDVHQTMVLWTKLLDFRQYQGLGLRENTYIMALCTLIVFYLAYVVYNYIRPLIENRPFVWFFSNVVVLTLAMIGVFAYLRPVSQFIYFQF